MNKKHLDGEIVVTNEYLKNLFNIHTAEEDKKHKSIAKSITDIEN